MKTVITRVLSLGALLSIALIASGQTAVAVPSAPFPGHFLTGGVSYNERNTPQIEGYIAYAPRINSGGLYSYNAVDITSVSRTPFRLQTQMSSGVAQWIGKAGGWDWFALGTAGVALSSTPPPAVVSTLLAASPTGTAIGAALSGGVFATHPIGSKGLYLTLSGKAIYSTTGGIQGPISIGLGWGK